MCIIPSLTQTLTHSLTHSLVHSTHILTHSLVPSDCVHDSCAPPTQVYYSFRVFKSVGLGTQPQAGEDLNAHIGKELPRTVDLQQEQTRVCTLVVQSNVKSYECYWLHHASRTQVNLLLEATVYVYSHNTTCTLYNHLWQMLHTNVQWHLCASSLQLVACPHMK